MHEETQLSTIQYERRAFGKPSSCASSFPQMATTSSGDAWVTTSRLPKAHQRRSLLLVTHVTYHDMLTESSYLALRRQIVMLLRLHQYLSSWQSRLHSLARVVHICASVYIYIYTNVKSKIE